jgi:hypothetical protein
LRPVASGTHDLGLAHDLRVTEGWLEKMWIGAEDSPIRDILFENCRITAPSTTRPDIANSRSGR